jgi:YD repeat-containing protein
MAEHKNNSVLHSITPTKWIVLFILLFLSSVFFRFFIEVFFQPKIGQDDLYLDALDLTRSKPLLEIYDPQIKFRVDLNGIPDNVLRSEETAQKPLGSFIEIPSGVLELHATDISVNRQDVSLDEGGSLQVEEVPDSYLSFRRVYRNDSSLKGAGIGYGWTHNFSYHFYKVDEIFTVVDCDNTVYSFSYDYKEEKYKLIRGLFSELRKEGEDFRWISPDRTHFVFAWNKKFSSYEIKQIKTYKGRLLEIEYDEESHRMNKVRDAGSELFLAFQYDPNGFMSQVSFSNRQTVKYSYDDTGNLLSARNSEGGYYEEYSYDNPYNIHNLTAVTDPEKRISVGYESQDRVQAVFHPEGRKLLFEYDDILGIVRVTDVRKKPFKYMCEGNGKLKVIDPLGNESFLFYGSSGLLTKAVFSNGAYFVKNYDTSGRITESESSSPDNLTFFEYHTSSGVLSKMVNSLGKTLRYVFNENDERGLPVKKIGYKGESAESYGMKYDSTGQLTELTAPSGTVYSISYDQAGNVKRVVSSAGWEKYYSYDQLGRLTAVINEDGDKTRFSYDDKTGEKRAFYPDGSTRVEKYSPAGRLLETTENGKSTAYQYDPEGRLLGIADHRGFRAEFKHDAAGNLIYKKDFDGQEYEYDYDPLCRLVKEQKKGTDFIVLYDYEKDMGAEQKLYSGRFTKKTLPDGEVLRKKYDKVMNETEVVYPSGKKEERVYDKLGHVTRIKVNESVETGYSYDDAGNLEAIYMPGEEIFFFESDWRHQITAAADPSGNMYIYSYDSNGRIQKVTNPDKQSAALSYDNTGNLTEMQFPGGMTYRYGYDEMGRLSTISRGEGDLTDISYDPEGREKSIAHSSGVFEARDYNPAGQLVSRSFADDTKFDYSYDSAGRLQSMKSIDNSVSYEYDAEGRIKKALINQQVFTYQYTKGGKISKITYPDKSDVNYVYDEKGLVKEITDTTGDKVVFNYDSYGRPSSIIYPNKIKESYSYSDKGNLSEIKVLNYKEENVLEAQFSYNYMALITSMKISQMQKDPQDVKYQYDAFMRCVKEMTGDRQSDYRYDPSGNLTEENSQMGAMPGTLKRTYSQKNDYRLEKVEDSLFKGGGTIPLMGTMTTKRPAEYVSINENVCQIDRKKNIFYLEKFTLNPGENLLNVEAVNQIGQKEKVKLRVFIDPNASAAFGYYPNGNLRYVSKKGGVNVFEWNQQNNLEKTINDQREITTYGYYANGDMAFTIDDLGGKTQFLYGLNHEIIAEADGEKGIAAKYVYTPDGRLLYKNERGEKKYFYHLLPDGSVKVMTDRFGNLAMQYSYDCFGNITDEVGRIKNNFLFRGMYLDRSSGIYFYQGRYYLPEFKIYARGLAGSSRLTENHQAPSPDILGIGILELHPDRNVMPLNTLKKTIDIFYEY